MAIIEAIRAAILGLSTRKVRALLTMLGVMIGVAAVIALVSIGRGVEAYIATQFEDLGTNLLLIVPGQLTETPTQRMQRSRPLTLADAEAISDPTLVPEVSSIAAEFTAPARISRAGNSAVTSVRGVTTSYADVRNWHPVVGDFFTQSDFDELQRVVVLGPDTYTALFGEGEYPINQTVRINNMQFEVIGVMEAKGGGPNGNRDETAFIPLSTAQDRLFRRKTPSGQRQVSVIYASIAPDVPLADAQTHIADILRQRRQVSYLAADDFSIVSQEDIISVFDEILTLLTLFLASVAAISLLIGGINIMNIMLVSVTERTREIGLRKALGATRSDILGQFVVEAATLALIGGGIGVLVGLAGAGIVSLIDDSFRAVVRIDAVLIALTCALLVGMFSGIYPAYRASRLDPIAALRTE